MSSKETSTEQLKSDAMQTSEEHDYEAHSGTLPQNTVYDFLYQDVRRVGSFLAQFDEYGVRQSVKATESVGQTQTVRGAASGTMGLPAVLGASANVDATTSDDTKDIAEHTFDPLWANSRRLLDYLNQHDLISADLWDARFGTFVAVEGTLSLLDTGMILPILQDRSLNDEFLATLLKNEQIDAESEQARNVKTSLSMIAKLPSAIHLYIYGDTANAWATVTSESLVTSAHDVTLKHGAGIRGRWNVLGIIDAWPDNPDEPTVENPDPQTLDIALANLLPDGIVKVVANLTNLTRTVIGRPRNFFGITPLLIYREVSG